MKIQNALVSNIFDRSQRYFAHVTAVTLSWRVQNIVVIGRIYYTLECFEFSSNFEFDRNMLSGTGARLRDLIAPETRWYICSFMRTVCTYPLPKFEFQSRKVSIKVNARWLSIEYDVPYNYRTILWWGSVRNMGRYPIMLLIYIYI